ncbi:hypothetical protein CRM22_005108 [Opisthorchis felineus]|uniref:Uncharacterized protein n=1 Tax=Opisthorchis felineus TaxID=147828 RepID=A0A4S2LSV0_OPIFE|nr:hypothetical protein CRM22_005108 [Opisthorchis felineus]
MIGLAAGLGIGAEASQTDSDAVRTQLGVKPLQRLPTTAGAVLIGKSLPQIYHVLLISTAAHGGQTSGRQMQDQSDGSTRPSSEKRPVKACRRFRCAGSMEKIRISFYLEVDGWRHFGRNDGSPFTILEVEYDPHPGTYFVDRVSC